MAVSGGDGGSVWFGEHGNVYRISISWRNLERVKSAQTYSNKDLIRLFHEGKWKQGPVPGQISGVDWKTVKSVVVKSARAYYCAGNSDLLYPFIAYTASVETEEGTVDMELDSPMIDESLPLPSK